MRKQMKQNDVGADLVSAHGITIITLVITIVILIILAGVTINLTIGENGLFNKAKEAKENYAIATNEEISQISNIEKKIEDYNSNENQDNSETKIESGEYFFTSYNGFKNVLGTGNINSLYGLTALTFETTPDVTGGWNTCQYEKKLNSPFDLSEEFEISIKNRFTTTSSNQIGQINVIFQKLNNENEYEDIITLGIDDAWGSTTQIQTSLLYNKEVLYEKKEGISTKYTTIGIIGDGNNIKIYSDNTLLTTTTQQTNLSFDKILIKFYQYPGYPEPNMNYLERLYFGNIKYYRDII